MTILPSGHWLLRFTMLIGLFAACGSPAWGAVLQVRSGQSIAAAIHSARAGDTIQVASGDYTENLVIDKPLTLQGLNRPRISGNKNGDVIRVRASDVRIQGFIVRDSGIDLTAQNAGIYVQPHSDRVSVEDVELTNILFGIWLEGSNDARIVRNTIIGQSALLSSARGNGIQVYNTKGAQIIGNNISFTRDGIYVDVSQYALFRGNKMHHLRYGTHYMTTDHSIWEYNETYLNTGGLALMEVRNLTVRNNKAWGNADHGIMLRTIQDSVIENNIVAANGRGFFIYDAEYNTLKNNLVIDNTVGVHLSAGSSNNVIDGNDFISNQEQIKFVAAKDVEWGKNKGNYWSNYSGWDQNGDGIGDVAYEANDVVDRLSWQYPLLKLLLSSPSVQTLHFVAQQFPFLRVPSIVDKHPRMRPHYHDWRNWIGKQRN